MAPGCAQLFADRFEGENMTESSLKILAGMLLEEKQYWSEKLSGELAVTGFPTDFKRGALPANRKDAAHFKISEETEKRLRDVSGDNQALIFTVLVTALKICLHKYTGNEDIIVGTTIHERHANTASLNRFLALRDRLSGAMTAKELLLDVKQTLSEAYANQKYPFGKILEMLNNAASENHSPLFNAVIILENINNSRHLEDLASDIAFIFSITNDGITGAVKYDASLFRMETIEYYIERYKLLLEAMIRSPQTRISDLPLLTEAERCRILYEMNMTHQEYASDACLHDLFETQARTRPDFAAVVCEDQMLTYGELNARANQLAHYLRRIGVGPETIVALCVERSVEMMVAVLGILKAGGAYVPLDPSYPKQRLAFMMKDCESRVLVTQQPLIKLLAAHEGEAVRIDEDFKLIAAESRRDPDKQTTAQNLAYVIYTSGSTGKPKGTMISHKSVMNLMKGLEETVYKNEKEKLRVGLNAPLAFDASMQQIAQLANGQTLCVVPQEIRRDAEALLDYAQRQEIDTLDCTPSQLSMMLSAGLIERGSEKLKKMLVGGEAIGKRIWERVARDEKRCYYNLYGPTECTVDATAQEISGEGEECIGKPLANAQIYILDRNQQLLPLGAEGEICISGEGLARGYWNQPELTQEKFIPHPFSREAGARLYKTGDAGRRSEDGRIQYIARLDDQVKVRGFRIELGEVEALLREYNGVKEAVAAVKETSSGEQRLTAYLVQSEGEILDFDHVRAYLSERLPEYMVPSAFLIQAKLPLTPSGKVDRRALPVSDGVRLHTQTPFSTPRDALEFKLIQIWEDVLDVHPVGVKDNFFVLGGHSLLAVSLMSRIENAFGIKLSVTTLFERATIENLAAHLRQHTDSPTGSTSLVEIQSGHSTSPFFCVHPAGGTVFCYVDLARQMGRDQPFYGLQSRGLYNGYSPHSRIEEMAAYYLGLIRAVQPNGPYLLGGWSIGGLVAFEMAQQLQAQGEQVAMLALLDTVAPTHYEALDHLSLIEAFAQYVGFYLQRLGISRDDFVQFDPDQQLNRILEHAKIIGALPLDFSFSQIRILFEIFVANANAALRYVPKTRAGRATLFKADEHSEQGDAKGWDSLLSDKLEVHPVPGGHFTMLAQPNVKVLAERLQVCIKKAVNQHTSSKTA